MSELINLNTLFASELGDTQQSLLNRGIAMADVPLGRMADVLAPKQASSLRKAAGGLFGVDTSTSKERLKQALTSLDLSNEGDQAKAVELVRMQNPAAALTLQQQFKVSREATELNQAQIGNQSAQEANQRSQVQASNDVQASLLEQRASLSRVVSESSLPPGRRRSALEQAVSSGNFDGRAIDLIKLLDPADKDKYLNSPLGIFNVEDGQYVTAPVTQGGLSFEMGKLNPSQHDTESLARYQAASSKATTPEERNAAINNILPRAPDNEVWKKTDQLTPEGLPKYRLFPEGELFTKTLRDIEAANRSGKTQARQSNNVLDTLDRIESAVTNGEASTGLLGVVLSSVSGSDTYTLSGDLDTILANLGYTALQDARKSSANGASGFGQLTAIELQRLEGLISSLRLGMKKEDFLERVAIVRKDFERSAKEAKTDWTPEQWLGFESPPESQTVTEVDY
jgi:hypothetical protein